MQFGVNRPAGNPFCALMPRGTLRATLRVVSLRLTSLRSVRVDFASRRLTAPHLRFAPAVRAVPHHVSRRSSMRNAGLWPLHRGDRASEVSEFQKTIGFLLNIVNNPESLIIMACPLAIIH